MAPVDTGHILPSNGLYILKNVNIVYYFDILSLFFFFFFLFQVNSFNFYQSFEVTVSPSSERIFTIVFLI